VKFPTALTGLLLLASQCVFAQPVKLAEGLDASSAGLTSADIDGSGKPGIIAWSDYGVEIFKYGVTGPLACGLSEVRDVISIAAGDFNNDGLPGLAILTKSGAALYANRGGKFEKLDVFLPEGPYNKAVWIDFNHDGRLDLFLLGDKSALLRNDGKAGFRDVSNNFPFVAGRAVDAETEGADLVVFYSDRPAVRYLDQLGGRYQAQELALTRPVAKQRSLAIDFNGDGRVDLITIESDGTLLFLPHGVAGK
jgi:hypothetical protein